MEVIFNLQECIFKKDQKTFLFTDENGKEHELSIHKLNRFLSLIAHKYLYNKMEGYEYAEVSSVELNNIDPNYAAYRKWLISNWIIISDGYYKIGNKGKKGKCIRLSFNDAFKDWGRVTEIRKDKFDEKTHPDQSYLIHIDFKIINKIRNDFKAIQTRDLPIEKEYKIISEKLNVIDFKSYLSSELNFWRMKNHDSYYNWKSGRLYNNFVQCSKSTRLNNFYFEDQLANLDIPSSFPLWLAVWLKDHGIDTENYEYRELCTVVKPKILKDGSFYKDVNGEIKTGFYNDLREKLNNNRNTILSKSVQKPITRCQLIETKEKEWDRDWIPIKFEKKKCNLKLNEGGWCPEHGYIQENDQSNTTRSEKPFISKGQAKENFQSWLNGDNELNNLINFIFKSYYGDIQSIVDQHKNGDKKYMYYQLVAMETNFIFNIISARLYAEIPDIRILTCHDQIYFEKRFFDQVEAIWIEELKKVYDRLPSFEEVEFDYSEMGLFVG